MLHKKYLENQCHYPTYLQQFDNRLNHESQGGDLAKQQQQLLAACSPLVSPRLLQGVVGVAGVAGETGVGGSMVQVGPSVGGAVAQVGPGVGGAVVQLAPLLVGGPVAQLVRHLESIFGGLVVVLSSEIIKRCYTA